MYTSNPPHPLETDYAMMVSYSFTCVLHLRLYSDLLLFYYEDFNSNVNCICTIMSGVTITFSNKVGNIFALLKHYQFQLIKNA